MGKSSIHCFSLLCWILFLSCSQNKEYKRPVSFAPKVVEAKGYLVPRDSVSEPKVVQCLNPVSIKAGKQKEIQANTNTAPAGKTKIIEVKSRVITPGQDSFLLPNTTPAISSSFIAGIPEVKAAKDPFVKDHNPENFSSFGKLQGLKHDVIPCMLQDKHGNLWLGTNGGGVCRYDGKSFTNFSEKEGLSKNNVWSMLEDKHGNLWFGTYGGGVCRYDGIRFTHFTEKQGLSNNTVRSILEDKKGNLWFGTYGGGVCKYDGKQFTNYTEKQGLSSNAVMCMLEDKKGNIWFGTDGGGICKYDGTAFTHLTGTEGPPALTIMSMFEDKSGNLWFGTIDRGVCKYDGNSFTYFIEKGNLATSAVMSIVEDHRGNLWFATYGEGICKYDGNNFTQLSEMQGLSNPIVLSLMEDRSGNLWIGTNGGGICKYDGIRFTHLTEKEGIPDNSIWSILEDKSGSLWIGTRGGVSKYNGKSFTNFTMKEGLPNNSIWCILEDRSGNLWFGTSGKGMCKYDGTTFTHFTEKEGLSGNTVMSILEDKSGSLWIGTDGGGVSKLEIKGSGKYTFTNFTKKEGLPDNTVRSILEDKNGNLWFGTNGGACKYDGTLFTHFTEKEGFLNNTVVSILEDKSGNFWFGTYGGLSKYDGKTFTQYTEKEGLLDKAILSVLEDKSGNLWFGTRFGLSKLSPENKEKLIYFSDKSNTLLDAEGKIFFKNYTYEDGFLGIGVNGGKTMCEDNSGTIWIAANDRLTAYHPESEAADTIAPNIQLTRIELFDEPIAWASLEAKKDTILTLGNGVTVSNFEFDEVSKWYGVPENLSLAYDNNFLTFNFIGITQKQSKRVNYQYKLEGVDRNWSVITSQKLAPYANLSPGTYSFKVKAMNSEGYWSPELNYTFTIRPPWWKTWWMYTVYATSAVASVILLVWWNGKRLRERARELEEEVDKATATIVEQKKIVEEKHKEITDSINYAERIQRSFLASTELLTNNLNDYFVFFKPRDVVSGDFYWAGKLSNGTFALATADSTGHGVPGAIMSILNISSIEHAVEQGYTQPSEILGQTRKTIIERLKKDGSAEGGKDGMDASLICFDFKNRKFTYSAANNPVWVVRTSLETIGTVDVKPVLIELKPDKMPVGKSDKEDQPFSQTEFELQKGDIVYTLTDGFPDQFGGPKGKKFMSKQLKELLVSISILPMYEQKLKLREVFEVWKGEQEQIDDVCIIGVKI